MMMRGPWIWSYVVSDNLAAKLQRMLDRASRCRRAKRLQECAQRRERARRLARDSRLTKRP